MKSKAILTLIAVISLFFTISCATTSVHNKILTEMVDLEQATGRSFMTYTLDLTNHGDDLFHVNLYPGGLSSTDQYFNFVAFAPGVHQTLDFGRFVKTFQAFDINNIEIGTENISTNRWKISDPERVSYIKYDIEDSFDAGVTEHAIYPMSGTGIEQNLILLNSFGVFGYFDELKKNPIRVSISYDPKWKIGTPLDKNEQGYYIADSYHHLIDSPFLIGDLTVASTMIGGINIEVYVNSAIEEINADTVLSLANDVLLSAKEFINFAPVDRYTFLMYFVDAETIKRNHISGAGALEHSYSSMYTLPARSGFLHRLSGIMAHEYMHILTPLNLHSEIIADFDFSEPTTEDLHNWLYEGLTEWVARIMPYRNGNIDTDAYLANASQKMESSEAYDPEYSLTKMSTDWPTEKGQLQWGNIYQRGALTAGMLDIKLLELSGGTRGLREVYLELINMYGKDNPFDNKTFFDTMIKMTYPEIADFIRDHIEGTVPIVYEDYYRKLGINYAASQPAEDKTPVLGISFRSKDGEHLTIHSFKMEYKNFGLKKGDRLLRLFDEEINISNFHKNLNSLKEKKAGDTYEVTVLRGDEELTFSGTLFENLDIHVLTVDENATEGQIHLREIWSMNLE